MTLSHDHILLPEGVYADARGRIIALPDFPTKHAMIIECNTGAVRGNHYHHHESHLMYVVSGRMIYLEQQADGEIRTLDVKPGEAVVSPVSLAHTTVFPEPTVIAVLSDVDRGGERYENEVVRVDPLQHQVDISHLYDGPQVTP
jgi:mannose-6-phosphate isomerase-like protein (cupin superfamily)